MQDRVHSIDAIRGCCLINIFINHLSAGLLTRGSPSNLGLSDSADVFVLLAGFSTVLAARNLSFRQAVERLWGRALALYTANLALIVGGLTMLAALAAVFGVQRLLEDEVLTALNAASLPSAIWHLMTLQQTVGYSLVLRLYVALMLLAPLLLWLTMQRWWLALPPAAALWVAAGQFGLVMNDSLTGMTLTMTILPWTLVFACGMAMGGAYVQGVRPPRSPWLVALALTMTVGYLAFLWLAQVWPDGQAWLAGRNDSFWLGASKTYQSPLRILHILSLAYLFVVFPRAPLIRMIHQVSPTHPLARLGRRSLPVFVIGSLLALPANELIHLAGAAWGLVSPHVVVLELAVVAFGVFVMLQTARIRRWPSIGVPRSRPVQIPPPQPVKT